MDDDIANQDYNKGERYYKKKAREAKYMEKEQELIEEEVQVDNEEFEDQIYDTLMVYLGAGMYFIAFVLILAREFLIDKGVIALLVFGTIILFFGLFWRILYKRHIAQEKKEIEEKEDEIRRL